MSINWSAERLAQVLQATPRGTGWVAPCPAHDDQTPSLSIWIGDNGQAAYDCKAGCQWKIVTVRLEALFPDAFASNGRPILTILAEYDYTDADGLLVGQVLRLEPKSFRQRKPNGTGGWQWKMDGLQLPLYHLPDLEKPTAIFICEGEKDVDALIAIGLPATCNPGGAGKWRKHHSAPLAGKRVCIIADKDTVGRAHAESVASALHGSAATVRIIEAPEPFKDAAEWIEGGAGTETIVEAAKSALAWAAAAGSNDKKEGRPIIEIAEGALPQMVDQAEAALMADPDHMGLFQRGGQIVRVVRLESAQEGTIKRAAGTPIIQHLPQAALVEAFSKCAHWVKFDGRRNDLVSKDCPRLVADTYASRAGSWELRPLVGVVDVPTLRPDGSVLKKPGYDDSMGLLLLRSIETTILEAPTREDAIAAMEELFAPLKGFPFDGEPSRSVVLACILTACIRYAVPTAPMFLFDAPAPGTGKSLLADVVSIIATGTSAASMSQAATGEEDVKRLFAVLLEGVPLVCIDNAERPFEGDALSSILTQPVYRGRVLGSNTTAIVPTLTTFLGTGNNISVRGDLSRRVILCRLDSALEHPEEREFKGDLRTQIRENRGSLVAAALTIVRAYHLARLPPQSCAPYGGFEQWSAWIRSAVMWVGCADPCESRKRVQRGDETARQLDSLLTAWAGKFGDQNVTVAQALHDPSDDLTDAVEDVAMDKNGGINSRRFGWWLVRYEGRISKGRCFASGPSFGSRRTWKVEEVE